MLEEKAATLGGLSLPDGMLEQTTRLVGQNSQTTRTTRLAGRNQQTTSLRLPGPRPSTEAQQTTSLRLAGRQPSTEVQRHRVQAWAQHPLRGKDKVKAQVYRYRHQEPPQLHRVIPGEVAAVVAAPTLGASTKVSLEVGTPTLGARIHKGCRWARSQWADSQWADSQRADSQWADSQRMGKDR